MSYNIFVSHKKAQICSQEVREQFSFFLLSISLSSEGDSGREAEAILGIVLQVHNFTVKLQQLLFRKYLITSKRCTKKCNKISERDEFKHRKWRKLDGF